MGMLGGALRAFGGNNVSVVSKVKNQQLQKALTAAIGDYNNVVSTGKQALGDYISKYLENVGQADKWNAQEVNAVDSFFNGNVSNRLAQLRASRAQAVNRAADVAAGEAVANTNRSRIADEGGPSSYDTRVLASTLAPIRANAAVDNANQERADYGFVEQGMLDNAGKRAALYNANASAGLLPQQAARSMESQNLGFLGNLLQADQLNHFYGLKQQANPWADFADAADQGILNAASIYSSVGGGMKHGGLVRIGSNAKKGGKVKGPGTETSDSIPIRVSDGEYVMPAAAVKMPGVLPMLERIRQLALRDSTAPAKKGGKDGRHFFGGGQITAGDMAYNQEYAQLPSGSTGRPMRGGGGGGTGGQAVALQARIDRDLYAQYFPSASTFGSEPAPGFEIPGMPNSGEDANAMPWFMNQA